MKAGSSKPAHKKWWWSLEEHARLVHPDYYGLTRLSVSGRLLWPLEWLSAPRPQKQTLNHRELQTKGLGGGREGGAGHTQKNSLYESLFLNQ